MAAVDRVCRTRCVASIAEPARGAAVLVIRQRGRCRKMRPAVSWGWPQVRFVVGLGRRSVGERLLVWPPPFLSMGSNLTK